MKENSIYVGGSLALSSGASAVAVLPVKKGGAHSLVLTEAGKLVRMKGSRLGGMGVPRFLESHGFYLADAVHPQVQLLARLADVEDGVRLVEQASQSQSTTFQRSHSGQQLKMVPFDADKAAYLVTVNAPSGAYRTAMDLSAGLSMGVLDTEYVPGQSFGVTAQQGWLIGASEDATSVPRSTEYGGTVELAAFIICASGLASLDGIRNLGDLRQTEIDAPFPRGHLRLKMASEDIVLVGISAVDELVVIYERDGQALYRRDGLDSLKLSQVVGSIAAVIVRVQEMDEAAASKTRKKRA